MRIVALAGGIGGARFLRGLKEIVSPADEITVIGNTGDDIHLFGLKVCPDLDTVMYTLGGGIHEEQGWGRADETFVVRDELTRYGVGPAWFGLDLPRHLTHFTPPTLRRMLERAGFATQPVRMIRHSDWLRSSAVFAGRCNRGSWWQRLLTRKPLAKFAAWTHYITRQSDCMLAVGEKD